MNQQTEEDDHICRLLQLQAAWTSRPTSRCRTTTAQAARLLGYLHANTIPSRIALSDSNRGVMEAEDQREAQHQ